MQKELTIALIQADLSWENSEENRRLFSKKIEQLTSTDLVILPEMFSTGFTMSPRGMAESMDGETVLWMRKMAYKKNMAIAGSIIISEGENFYNRFLFVFPTGEIKYYDKRHLFTLAGEDKVYTSGKTKELIHYKGWKICPMICYDLRFPVWARNVEEYDLLIYVANWPKPRVKAWDTLLKARSIENMCYTAGVNRVGTDANGLEYSGHSAVYDCLGIEVALTSKNKEDMVVVTLRKSHISMAREQLNFLSDRDHFSIDKEE